VVWAQVVGSGVGLGEEKLGKVYERGREGGKGRGGVEGTVMKNGSRRREGRELRERHGEYWLLMGGVGWERRGLERRAGSREGLNQSINQNAQPEGLNQSKQSNLRHKSYKICVCFAEAQGV
jgi:hypothetical protein